jgi:hypothetical protein
VCRVPQQVKEEKLCNVAVSMLTIFFLQGNKWYNETSKYLKMILRVS